MSKHAFSICCFVIFYFIILVLLLPPNQHRVPFRAPLLSVPFPIFWSHFLLFITFFFFLKGYFTGRAPPECDESAGIPRRIAVLLLHTAGSRGNSDSAAGRRSSRVGGRHRGHERGSSPAVGPSDGGAGDSDRGALRPAFPALLGGRFRSGGGAGAVGVAAGERDPNGRRPSHGTRPDRRGGCSRLRQLAWAKILRRKTLIR